ncbi:5-formyltetrahydrofolate cyclo-ligase [Virgibacillus subterraneus]|uniref:5-formyltetrahydrofolate cyclo-ligase n=1 Tax=Virgibacillus subterraneus TaxID=621109 RepID=A0A1H9E216_9BACI|nr:5-formyltetrahydrofolate cyclo-ligase [Virgibacillus subterraneus]SEQ18988.1 5-formyltetrahydrofolate cyclo-ligase [Virgibacillus subterraneus]
MDKSELRKNAISMLKGFSEEERKNIEEKLTQNVVNSDFWKQSAVVGVTISNGFEWNTKPIIETAWNEGKSICVPKCRPKDRKLEFYKINTYEQLEVVYYNLLEPIPEKTEKIDKRMIELLIVPGLLFDGNGFRIGFGGGYYDRFLSDFPNKRISIASNEQIVEGLPAEPFDIPVDRIITESGFL